MRGMKSMTGYGRGECAQDGFKVTAELSSVNRKQAEVSVTLPRELELLESQVRDAVNRCVARGRVNVRVSLHAGEGKISARNHLNTGLAKAYATELAKLAANGAEVTQSGGRVRIHFSLAARAAVEKVRVTPYVDKVAASDNLRYALDGGSAATAQPALGKAAEMAAPTN